ncbi:MAG: pyridoxal phosphate-dependent aminotransferase, partial [Bacteroidales bacterium]|nr:pyridoxal phosphate-dependent aminotransferase [Bacteroidales bacterium]
IMKKYNFDKIIDRKGTNSFKWDAGDLLVKMGYADRFDNETISLFVADMDFESSEPVLEALKKTVDQNIFGYTTHIFSDDYFEALISWFKRKQNWQINKQDVVYCPGTVHALNIAIQAYTKPNQKVIIQQPVYAPFNSTVVNNGRVVSNNELVNNNGYYTIDFEDLEKKAKDPEAKMMFLCSPHNPVGRIWTTDELTQIAKICTENDVVLVSDEIHADLIRSDKTFYSVAHVSDLENVVICTAINKTFNLAGLHCSNIVIKNKNLREKFQTELGVKSPSPFEINALIAAYNYGDEWLEQLKVYLDETFNFIENFLKENMPTVKFWKPEGTYLTWLDFSDYNLTPSEIHKRIYTDANVVLQDGKAFGQNSSYFQRICIPSPKSVIAEALDRISKQFK